MTASLTIISERKIATLPGAMSPQLQTLYSPSTCQLDGTRWLFAQGGYLDRPVGAPPLGNPERFADKGYAWYLDAWGKWVYFDRVLMAATFPWMLAPGSVVNDEDRIGAIASIQPLIRGNEFRLEFTAVMEDPNDSTGVHRDGSNQYGPINPAGTFSHFQAYSATLRAIAPGRTRFVLDNYHRPFATQQSLQTAFIYYEPSAVEAMPDYQGLVGQHSALFDPATGETFRWYEFRRTTGQSQLLTKWSDGGLWLYDGQAWNRFADGALTSWVNAPDDPVAHWPKGNIFPHIVSHVQYTHVFDGSRFIIVANPASVPEFSLTNDITRPGDIISITGASGPMDDCHYYEEDGVPHLLFARQVESLGELFAGREIWDATMRAAGSVPVILPPIVPPVDPPVVPPVILPFAYYLVNPPGTLDESLLTVAHGYVLGDTWYTGPLGWRINKVGEPPPLAGDWIRKDEVKR